MVTKRNRKRTEARVNERALNNLAGCVRSGGGGGVGKAMRLDALAWLTVRGWLAGHDSLRLTDENIHGARNFGLPSSDVVLSGNGTGQSGGGS